MEKSKKSFGIIIILLIIIIIVLVGYILCSNKFLYGKNEKVDNKSLLVLDDISYKESEESETVILKVKNNSSKVFNNVTPVLIYYDDNNMPIHEGWGAVVSYFAPGEIRCIRFYDTIKDYNRVEIGMFDIEDNVTYTDLRDKIVYEVKKADEPNEDGEIELSFKGENKYDKDVFVSFEIDYYSDDKLIFEDQFSELVAANSSFDTYQYYATKFYDGTEFPKGYTYEVKLVEAVESIDSESDFDDEDNEKMDIPEGSVEDKIESAVFKLLKNNYGDELASAKIYVNKTYTAEQAKNVEGVKDIDLGENDIAFEVSIYIEPAEGADPMQFTIPDGEYNKKTGWVSGIGRLGVLRQDQNGKYEITNYGTGW